MPPALQMLNLTTRVVGSCGCSDLISEWCQNAYDSWLYISIVESPIPKRKVNKPHWLLMAGLLRQVFCYCSYCWHKSSKKPAKKNKIGIYDVDCSRIIVRLTEHAKLYVFRAHAAMATQYLWSFWVSDPLAIKSLLKVVSGAVNPRGNGGVSPRYRSLHYFTMRYKSKRIKNNLIQCILQI